MFSSVHQPQMDLQGLITFVKYGSEILLGSLPRR